MSKRFISTDIWEDPWVQNLSTSDKLVWIYVFTKCDMIGIWEFNPKRAEFDLGKKFLWEQIIKSFEGKVIFFEEFWIIKNFIREQYPNLNKKPKAPLHISVLNHINKMCLNFDLNSLSIDYTYPINRVQVKVKVKEEVILNDLINTKEEDSSIKSVDIVDWKNSFEEYLKIAEPEFDKAIADYEWISQMKRDYRSRRLCVIQSVEKMWRSFWGTEEGWKHCKKKKKGETMNWRRTIENGLSMPINQVQFAFNETDWEADRCKREGFEV